MINFLEFSFILFFLHSLNKKRMKIVTYQKTRFVYALKILSRKFTTESSFAHFYTKQSGFIYAELQFISMHKKIKIKPPGIDPVSYTLLYEQ